MIAYNWGMMSKKSEEKVLIMFPSSKPKALDPLEELLNEYGHLSDEDVIERIELSELDKNELMTLRDKLKSLSKEQKRLKFYIDQIEQNIDQ